MHINKILIIDDSPVARMLLKKCLGKGFEILEAGSGEEGLDMFLSMALDLVFLDLTMPGMGGLAALQKMGKTNPDIPVVVISADRQASTLKEVMDHGAATVLKKPPRQESIQKTIHSLETGEQLIVEGLEP